MPTKVKELDNTKDGDRNACPVCKPRRGIPADRLWARSLERVGQPVFKDQ